MKIKGYGEVSTLRLKHKGCEMNMEHIYPAVYMGNVEVELSASAFLEFKDTMEIDAMIFMLEKFKKLCFEVMGDWRYTQN